MWTRKDTNRVDVYEKTSLIITHQSPYTLHAERNCLFIYPIKSNLKFSRVHLNLGRNSSLFGHKIQDGSAQNQRWITTATKCQANGEIGRYRLHSGVYCIVGCSRLDRYVFKCIFLFYKRISTVMNWFDFDISRWQLSTSYGRRNHRNAPTSCWLDCVNRVKRWFSHSCCTMKHVKRSRRLVKMSANTRWKGVEQYFA